MKITNIILESNKKTKRKTNRTALQRESKIQEITENDVEFLESSMQNELQQKYNDRIAGRVVVSLIKKLRSNTIVGTVKFLTDTDLPPKISSEVVDYLKNKDFEIEHIWDKYEVDPGERIYYPEVSFYKESEQ
jgi:hypothetical protein